MEIYERMAENLVSLFVFNGEVAPYEDIQAAADSIKNEYITNYAGKNIACIIINTNNKSAKKKDILKKLIAEYEDKKILIISNNKNKNISNLTIGKNCYLIEEFDLFLTNPLTCTQIPPHKKLTADEIEKELTMYNSKSNLSCIGKTDPAILWQFLDSGDIVGIERFDGSYTLRVVKK